ncbi:MAG: hypothetical protein ABMA64_35110 [Myxococcota bacterium]
MNGARGIGFLAAWVTVEVAAWAYVHLTWAGFPDGHLTELDRAEQWLFGGFAAVGLAFGLAFAVLGWRAGRRPVGRALALALAAYLALALGVAATHAVLASRLDSGQGG